MLELAKKLVTVRTAKAAVMAAIFTFSSFAAFAQNTAVTLRLDWLIYGMHAPFFVALEKGYYNDANLDVTILEGKGSSVTVALIGNGNDTFGFADSGTAAKAIANGVPITVIAGMLQKSSMTLTSFAESGIKTPQDLEGKSLGLGAAEALTQVLPAFLAKNNVDPDKVRIVTMPPAARPPALMEGRIEAIGGSIYGDALRFALENPDRKFSYLKFGDWGVSMLGHGLLASNDTIANSPDVVRRFIAATSKGVSYAVSNPDESVAILMQRFDALAGQEAYLAAQINMIDEFSHSQNSAGKPFGWQSEDDWKSMQDFLVQFGGVPNKLPLDSYYTNQFIGQ